MALTELQLPTKTELFGNLQALATNMNSILHQWEDATEFLADIETVDLDALGIAIGQVRTDLVDFRIVISEVVAFFRGTSTSQTKVPQDIIDRIRKMR
jgi:hypothetical protein